MKVPIFIVMITLIAFGILIALCFDPVLGQEMRQSLGYISSAIIGVTVIGGVLNYSIDGKSIFSKKKDEELETINTKSEPKTEG